MRGQTRDWLCVEVCTRRVKSLHGRCSHGCPRHTRSMMVADCDRHRHTIVMAVATLPDAVGMFRPGGSAGVAGRRRIPLRPPSVAPPGGLISCRAHIVSAARSYSVRIARMRS